jgi:hypothetical protein
MFSIPVCAVKQPGKNIDETTHGNYWELYLFLMIFFEGQPRTARKGQQEPGSRCRIAGTGQAGQYS